MVTHGPNICNYVNMLIMAEIGVADSEIILDKSDRSCDIDRYRLSREAISELSNYYPECHDRQIEQRLDDIVTGLDEIIEVNKGTAGMCRNWESYAESAARLYGYVDGVMNREMLSNAFARDKGSGTGAMRKE